MAKNSRKPVAAVKPVAVRGKNHNKSRSKNSRGSITKELLVPVPTWRYTMIGVMFGAMFVALIVRAIFLQVIDTEYLQSQGDARYLRVQKEIPTRGMILDRNGQPLALSTPVDSIWIHPPTIIKQKNDYSYEKLTALLGISRATLLRKAESKKSRQFMYLKRHLAPQVAKKILALGVPGVNSVREYKRYYPAGPVFGHVLGFTNIDNEGQEGFEWAYNQQLKGKTGRTQVLRDRVGHVVEHVEQLSRVQHGDNITLSIDARIQYLAYRYLQAAVKKHKASSASLVALDAKTGEVLAMVSAPDFNPNDRSDLKSAKFKNRSITDSFEPGSTMKPFTIAMAMDEGVVTTDTMIDTSPGYLYIGRNRINDTSNHGVISVADVIKVSSNIGAAKIAMMMQPRDLYDVYHDLGFGQTNKLKLQGETRGILTKRKTWRPIEHATLSYGYGLSMNTLQLARSYQALANGGVLLPVSLSPVTKTDMELRKGKRVFKQKTVDRIALMLETVVSPSGTAPKAQVQQYRVAGKTGTAHRVVDGKYQDDSYMSIFAGFAPVSDPEIVIVVSVNDPRGVDYYGGLVAAPVFSKVMEGALRFRDVAPDGLDDTLDKKTNEPLKLMILRPESVVTVPPAKTEPSTSTNQKRLVDKKYTVSRLVDVSEAS